MAAKMFNNVQPSADTAEMRLTKDDMNKLQEILDRKLHGMFPEQREKMPKLGHILDGDLDVREPYDKDPNALVDDGATYWGMLYYRGAIMRNLDGNVPIPEWDIHEVIAMFCSGIDKNHSFSRLYYSEIRTRLMYALYKRVALRRKRVKGKLANDNIALLVAYTLACMEYEGGKTLGDYYDKIEPTQHIRRFAELYMKHPEDFTSFNDSQGRHMRKDVAKYLLDCTYKPEWQLILNTGIKANLDFMFPGDIEKMESMAYKKHRNRTSRRPTYKAADGLSEYPRPLPDDDKRTIVAKRATGRGFSLPYRPDVIYDPTRIKALAKKDAFVQALIEPMPNVKAEVELTVKASLSNFNTIKASFGMNDDKENEAEGIDPNHWFSRLLHDLSIPGMIQIREDAECTLEELNAEADGWLAELAEVDRREALLRAAEKLSLEDEEMVDEEGNGSEGSE